MKKILIDVNSIIPYYIYGYTTGVGRSTFELVKALSTLNNLPFNLTLYSQNLRGYRTKGRINLDEFHLYLPNHVFIRRAVNTLRLKSLFTNYDLLHIPHNTDCCERNSKTIYTIHDLIVYHYPKMWQATEIELNSYKTIGRKCRAIITCSESSKKDILHYWQLPEEKVTAIPWGINREVFHPRYDKGTLVDLGISDSYYFSASCNHPRKNTALLLSAYRRYLSNGGKKQLVLLSPMAKDINQYEDLIERRKVIIIRNLSDTELTTLYSHAHCTLMTSSYEGFGLPILESLACGTQVLSSNNSSLPEVGGNIIDYFDELDSECIYKKMLEVDTKDKHSLLNEELLQKHLDEFTWRKCAERYVSTYERLLYCS